MPHLDQNFKEDMFIIKTYFFIIKSNNFHLQNKTGYTTKYRLLRNVQLTLHITSQQKSHNRYNRTYTYNKNLCCTQNLHNMRGLRGDHSLNKSLLPRPQNIKWKLHNLQSKRPRKWFPWHQAKVSENNDLKKDNHKRNINRKPHTYKISEA